MSDDPKHLIEAFVAIGYWCDDPDGTDEDLRGILREAIREAQASARDDALEEAAVRLEEGIAETKASGGVATTRSPWAASVVRSLKPKG